MKAVIVYQSLWGSTAAIARAIAEGTGAGAVALSTSEATPEVIAGADLIVAGCPVHAFNLPSVATVEQAVAKPVGRDAVVADPSHRLMRDWLAELRKGSGRSAAFDTRVRGPLGKGGASKIAARLEGAGYSRLVPREGFFVTMKAVEVTAEGMLLPGEVERAREWGRALAAALSEAR
jgi:hypothetical protein